MSQAKDSPIQYSNKGKRYNTMVTTFTLNQNKFLVINIAIAVAPDLALPKLRYQRV